MHRTVLMNEDTGERIFRLLDVISIEVGAVRNDVRHLDAKVTGLEVKVDRLEQKVDRLDIRVGRLETRLEGVETRVEGVDTGLRSFRQEFEQRIAPLER